MCHIVLWINCCKPLLIAVEEKKWPGSNTIISLFQVFICTYFDFSITLALYKVHRTSCSFSTSFFQLSDALDFLQSHKHENEQGNITVKRESGNLDSHTEKGMMIMFTRVCSKLRYKNNNFRGEITYIMFPWVVLIYQTVLLLLLYLVVEWVQG